MMASTEPQRQLGKYAIQRELGRGGFATVYLAQDTVLRRAVALKVLHPVLLTDPAFVARFESEARAIAQFEHSRIAMIYDLEHYEGRLCIAMQLMPGGSLADRIQQHGRLPFADALRVVGDVAEALDHAHAAGFLHRDVKPSNILFNARGDAVLSDFGLVKAAEGSVIARTAMGSLLGTPPYMAPEVWEGKGDSLQTDVYALGCVLYEMLTGAVLFKGDTPPAVMLTHFQPRQYSAQWPEGTPPGITRLFDRALAREPAERYASAGALAAELRGLGAPKAAAPPKVQEAPPPAAPLGAPKAAAPPKVQEAPPPAAPLDAPKAAAPPKVQEAPLPATVSLPVEREGDRVSGYFRQFGPALALLPLAMTLDIAGGELVKLFQLPLWLDNIGTVLMGWLFGPWIGALASLLGRVVWWLLGRNDYSLWYAGSTIAIGMLAGFAEQLGLLRRTPPRWLSVLIGGVLGFGLVLLVLMYGALTQNPDGWPYLPNSHALVAENGPVLLVATVLGLLAGFWLLKHAGYVGLVGLITGLITAILSAPVTAHLFGSEPGSAITAAMLGRETVADPLDKLIIFLIAWPLVHVVRARLPVLKRQLATGAAQDEQAPASSQTQWRTSRAIVGLSAAWIIGWSASIWLTWILEGDRGSVDATMLAGWATGWACVGLFAGLWLRRAIPVTQKWPTIALAIGWPVCMTIALILAAIISGGQLERGLDALALGVAVAAGIAGSALRGHDRAFPRSRIALLALGWAIGWRLAEVLNNDGSGGGPWHGVLYKLSLGHNFHAAFGFYPELAPIYLIYGGILGAALGAGLVWLFGKLQPLKSNRA